MNILSAYLAYKLIELLSQPFEKWKAYKLGLIDEDGYTVRKPLLSDEKMAFGLFEKIIRNIRQKMAKVVGPSKAAALLSTIYLIKENGDETTAKMVLNYCLKECVELQNYLKFSNRLKESLSNVWANSDESIIKQGTYKLRKKEIELTEDLNAFDKFCGIYMFRFDGKVFTKAEVIDENFDCTDFDRQNQLIHKVGRSSKEVEDEKKTKEVNDAKFLSSKFSKKIRLIDVGSRK
jgi:hypothetical protein